MIALVKVIIVSLLSFITGITQTDKTTGKESVINFNTENCEVSHKCTHTYFHGKYDKKVYYLELNCTT